MAGPCKVCGANSWDTDDIRGETSCSECGYVATENMIDPGAEWINHSDGDDRSRVGAPTTLTLSDKGLSTEIRRSDLTGRSIRCVSAACVYIAAREAKIPRKIEDVAEAFDMIKPVEEKELKRTIRLVARMLGTHHITGPEEYFEKFHSDLGLPPHVLGGVRDLWDSVKDDLSWQGKKPSGIAGVIIYKASQESSSPRTQSEVCKVSGISEVTLRGLLKILAQLTAE